MVGGAVIALARPVPGARDMGARWRAEIGADRYGDALGEAGGNLVLGHQWPVLDRVAVDQVDPVAVAAKGAGAGRHVVGEDPVAALARALRAGIGDDILGL